MRCFDDWFDQPLKRLRCHDLAFNDNNFLGMYLAKRLQVDPLPLRRVGVVRHAAQNGCRVVSDLNQICFIIENVIVEKLEQIKPLVG